MASLREIVTAAELEKRVAEVGQRIDRDFPEGELVLVGILKDATVLLADLLRRIERPVRYELVNVTRQSAPRREVIELAYATHIDLAGAHALILKDICHSGVTENYLLTHLAQQRPASLEVVALVNRPQARRVALQPRYVVLDELPDARLVGYGMEYDGRWGNLDGIHALDEV